MFNHDSYHVLLNWCFKSLPFPPHLHQEGAGHAGTKPSRVTFCGVTNKLFTTGFTRSSERQYSVWDAGDLSKSLTTENIDTGSGVLFPFWDEGTKMVYVAGKVCVHGDAIYTLMIHVPAEAFMTRIKIFDCQKVLTCLNFPL